MNLFKDEKVLLTTDGNEVILTTHRIRCNIGDSSRSLLTSIMLEKISSVQISYRSYPILLVIAVFLTIIGLGAGIQGYGGSSMAIPLVFAVIVGIIYLYSRLQVCLITSDGGSKLIFKTKGMGRNTLIDFINTVEKAKHDRVSKIGIN